MAPTIHRHETCDKYKYLNLESSSPPSEAAVGIFDAGGVAGGVVWWGLVVVGVGVASDIATLRLTLNPKSLQRPPKVAPARYLVVSQRCSAVLCGAVRAGWQSAVIDVSGVDVPGRALQVWSPTGTEQPIIASY